MIKLRRSADNVTITHDLTVQQREELHELIKEAKNKEECDQPGRFIYRVRGPHGDGMSRKLQNPLSKEIKRKERNRRVEIKNKLKMKKTNLK